MIVNRLDEMIKEVAEADKQEGVDYMMGRIHGYIWKLEQAVMPLHDSHKSPREWQEGAMDDLLVVESKLRHG